MSSLLKKFAISTSSALILSSSVIPALAANASENAVEETEVDEAEIYETEEFINDVEPYVTVNDNGHLHLQDDIPEYLYEKYRLEELEQRFVELNFQKDQGQLVIEGNLEITDNANNLSQPEISPNALSSGYRVENYWWGSRTFFTNQGTETATEQLELATIGVASAGAIVSAKFPPLAPIGTTLVLYSSYLTLLRSRMNSNNNGNGVIVDMTRVDAFSVRPRPEGAGGGGGGGAR